MNRSPALQGDDLADRVVLPATDPFSQVFPLQARPTGNRGRKARVQDTRAGEGTGSRTQSPASAGAVATQRGTKLLTRDAQSCTLVDTMPRPVPRTTMITARFAQDEREEVERVAQAEQMTVSDYVRTATLGYMALRGNRLAWKRIGAGMLNVLQDAARKVAALSASA